MVRAIPCLALLLGIAASARAADSDAIWSGTLGRAPIVVRITDAPPSATGGDAALVGSYYYRAHRLDIQLEGRLDRDGRWRLVEHAGHPGGEGGPAPRWTLPAPGRGPWRGEWIGADGHRLPIVLSRIAAAMPDAAEPGLTALRGEFDPYEYLRLATVHLARDKDSTFNGHVLEWWTEPASGIHLFQVASGYPEETRARINRTLRARLWHWIADYYGCVSGTGLADRDYAATTTVRQVDAHVVSASLFSSFYCGGAHPDFADAPVNIDARTGKALDLEDVLWLGRGPAIHAAPGDGWNKAWAAYRETVFAPWVVRTLKATHPRDMVPAGGDADASDCEYADPELWNFPAWYVTPRGIHVAAYFPRVARVCDDPAWAVLPWQAVDAHRGVVPLH